MTADTHPHARSSTGLSATAVVLLLLLLVVVAGASFWAGMSFANASKSPHDNKDFELFWQSWDILDREYYYGPPKTADLVHSAIQGLMAAPGDPYTFFVPPTQAELDRQVMAGEFGGIGAYVAQNRDGQLAIIEPFSGLPAEQAGLKADDVILEVNGVSIEGWAIEDAVSLLRGEIGTQVALTVYRPAEDRRFSVEITRARVEMPTTYSQMIDDVAYVRLFSFNENAADSVQTELSGLLDQNPQAVILDLRGNPGGLLEQAVEVSDLFLDQGIVVSQRSRQGAEIVHRSADGDLAENIPLAVLIDGRSASASEVVAGALQDRGRAVVIGQTSFGKGSVQFVHNLPDGSQLHITGALWFTPNEKSIQGQGITPDVAVGVPDNLEPDQDPTLDAALNYVHTEVEHNAESEPVTQ